MKKRTHYGDGTPRSLRVVAAVMFGMLGASCGAAPAADQPSAAPASPAGVAGLGRIEPGDGVVVVAVRSPVGTPIVARLQVKKGETVQAGQVLAELDNKTELAAAVQHAASVTEVARKRLAQARAGAKPSDLSAQQAEIERLETELANARTDEKRYASLGNNVSAEELDRLKLRVETTMKSLGAARERLTSLTEVRAVDVEVAEAQLQEAIRAEARAQADARTSTILAPIEGRVIEINAWPGEQVGSNGLLELAPNAPMYAVAEIAETDAARVRVGQPATISGGSLDKPLQGTVERISSKVLQNAIMPVSPENFSDARVVEVWIRIADSSAVIDRIHMRVDVVIQS